MKNIFKYILEGIKNRTVSVAMEIKPKKLSQNAQKKNKEMKILRFNDKYKEWKSKNYPHLQGTRIQRKSKSTNEKKTLKKVKSN